MIQWLLIFTINVALDVVYAKYTIATTARRPVEAGLWATAIILVGAASIVLYTNNYWLVIPAAAGAFVGTYYTVKPK